MDSRSDATALLLLIPVYNDWEPASMLLAQLDVVLAREGLATDVLLVDDASTSPPGVDVPDAGFRALRRIDVLGLRRNVGHQRAIALGLAFVHDRRGPSTVLVMDGDGEDAPRDVPALLARMRETGGTRVIFAARRRRSEQLLFRVFYWLYRMLHVALTGIPVRVGNFSVIPHTLLGRVVVVSELWNHYAAAVYKARVPHDSIPTHRAPRLAGRSRMNFVALVSHGLSALSVHAEVIGVRLLVLSVVMAALVALGAACMAAALFFTAVAVPGWATAAFGALVLLLCQAVAAAVFFIILVLHGRSQPLFIPIRDYAFFVSGVTPFYPASDGPAAHASATMVIGAMGPG